MKMKVADPLKVEITLTVTLSLQDWIHLREQLLGNDSPRDWRYYPGVHFRDSIMDMVRQLERDYYPQPKPQPMPQTTAVEALEGR